MILGLWAFASMLGGIVFGSRHWGLPLARQVMVLSALLALVLVPAPFVGSVPLLGLTTFLAGAAVAPALIANFSLTERLVPGHLLTEGLTWTNSGLALGFSAGTTLGGIVIDAHGTAWAFVLPILSAGDRLRRGRARPAHAPARVRRPSAAGAHRGVEHRSPARTRARRRRRRPQMRTEWSDRMPKALSSS